MRAFVLPVSTSSLYSIVLTYIIFLCHFLPSCLLSLPLCLTSFSSTSTILTQLLSFLSSSPPLPHSLPHVFLPVLSSFHLTHSDPDKPGGDTAKFQQLQASYQEILKKKAEAAATEKEMNGGEYNKKEDERKEIEKKWNCSECDRTK